MRSNYINILHSEATLLHHQLSNLSKHLSQEHVVHAHLGSAPSFAQDMQVLSQFVRIGMSQKAYNVKPGEEEEGIYVLGNSRALFLILQIGAIEIKHTINRECYTIGSNYTALAGLLYLCICT